MTTNTRTEIATGILTWDRDERVSDRYGTIGLMPVEDGRYMELPAARPLVNRHGRLIAIVVATRRSQHIGDLFRGVGPTTPQVGEEITLGTGTLFLDRGGDDGAWPLIGLEPDDHLQRAAWLDPRQLYRAHSQTVRLVFEEA